ncbi:hypothetical protein BaRGS_00024881 [Batillaria attramentaria]|uniref:Uncharacterized protein n=1 Tax=Batillaria attramentaria TaxID=370345 RepID=A0ABD0K9Q6_9CAEN
MIVGFLNRKSTIFSTSAFIVFSDAGRELQGRLRARACERTCTMASRHSWSSRRQGLTFPARVHDTTPLCWNLLRKRCKPFRGNAVQYWIQNCCKEYELPTSGALALLTSWESADARL